MYGTILLQIIIIKNPQKIFFSVLIKIKDQERIIMNISPLSFYGRPSGFKPSNNQAIKKMWEAGLPTNRYRTPHTKDSLNKEIEFCREILKENPENQIFRTLYEEYLRQLKVLQGV